MEDTPKKMLRAATRFFSGTMLSRVSGMLRDIAMAFTFGTEASLAAFFIAFRFAHLLRRLLGEGTLQTAFIPHFEAVRNQEKNPRKAFQFYLDLYVALSLLLIALVIVGMGISVAFFRGYLGSWSPMAIEVSYLCFLMLPSLLFICLSGLNCALLQCEHSYFLVSVSPIAFNLIWIIGVLVLQGVTPSEAMPRLALFIVVACFFQWAFTVPKVIAILRDSTRKYSGKSFFYEINPFSSVVMQLWRPFLLGIVGIGAAQINSACDAVFASYAESAGPAYLWFAIRLQQLPLALFGIALSGALLPPLTRAIAAGDAKRSSSLFASAMEKSTVLIVPVTLLIFLLGKRSIDLLYGYGDFDKSSVEGTAYCLWGYGIGLIPMTFVLVMAPAFYARKNYRIPTLAALISVVFNMLLNVLFVIGFGWGAFSIAIGTSLSAWLNMVLLGFFLESQLRAVLWQTILSTLSQVVWPLALASGLVVIAANYLPAEGTFLVKASTFGALAIVFGLFFLAARRFTLSKTSCKSPPSC